MCQKNIALKGPERVFEADEGGLPIIDDFEVSDDLVEVLEPATVLVLTERTFSVIDFCAIIENA